MRAYRPRNVVTCDISRTPVWCRTCLLACMPGQGGIVKIEKAKKSQRGGVRPEDQCDTTNRSRIPTPIAINVISIGPSQLRRLASMRGGRCGLQRIRPRHPSASTIVPTHTNNSGRPIETQPQLLDFSASFIRQVVAFSSPVLCKCCYE